MVRMPQNVLASMAIGKPGLQATKKELIACLEEGGYGPAKAKKWVETYIDTGAIRLVGQDPVYGRELYVCKWWGSMPTITRTIPQRVRVDLTEDEAAIIEAWSVAE